MTENSVGYPASASLVSYTVEASDGDLSINASLIGGLILPIVEREKIHSTLEVQQEVPALLQHEELNTSPKTRRKKQSFAQPD